jgi:hypothetical protein
MSRESEKDNKKAPEVCFSSLTGNFFGPENTKTILDTAWSRLKRVALVHNGVRVLLLSVSEEH